MPPRLLLRSVVMVILPLAMTAVLLAGCLEGVQIVDTGSRYVIEYHTPTPTPPTPYGTPTPDECSIYRAEAFRPLLGTPFETAMELQEWITETFGLATEEGDLSIKETHYESLEYLYLSIDQNTRLEYPRSFSAYTIGGTVIAVPYSAPPSASTLAHALDCLGAPDGYIAEYFPGFEFMGPSIQMRLFYPEFGEIIRFDFALDAHGELPELTLAPHPMTLIPEAVQDGGIVVMLPTKSSQDLLWDDWHTIERFYGQHSSEEIMSLFERDFSMLRLWPKDGESFVFDTRPRGVEWKSFLQPDGYFR